MRGSHLVAGDAEPVTQLRGDVASVASLGDEGVHGAKGVPPLPLRHLRNPARHPPVAKAPPTSSRPCPSRSMKSAISNHGCSMMPHCGCLQLGVSK